MHPNTYLKSFWRSEILDQVFVAMSFRECYHKRYTDIIRPAIEDELIEGYSLKAYRVDNLKTVDSILTDICDGIAHSRIILADVSVIDEGRNTNLQFRNGNVMYEVGIALASRQPSEVLIIRDDSDKILFDVSTIPHIQINFSNSVEAVTTLREKLHDRVKETSLLEDARLRIAAQSLTPKEFQILTDLSKLGPNRARDYSNQFDNVPIQIEAGVTRLLQKGCVRSVAVQSDTNALLFAITQFGQSLLESVERYLPKLGKESAISPPKA
jgi:DNA-binding MarR family transcriptional regulator